VLPYDDRMMMTNGTMGAFKPLRAVKKAGKTVAKTAVKVAVLPAKLTQQLALKAAGVVCQLPPPVLMAAGTAAGVPAAPVLVPTFCAAVRGGQLATIIKLLPQVSKIAAAAVATRLPAKKAASIPEPEEIVTEEQSEDVEEEMAGALAGIGADDVVLLGYAEEQSLSGLAADFGQLSERDIGDALGVAPGGAGPWVGLFLGLGFTTLGFWMLSRARRY